MVEAAHRHVVPHLAEVLRAAGRVGQAGVDAVVVDARLVQGAVLVRLALALQRKRGSINMSCWWWTIRYTESRYIVEIRK